MSTVHETGLKFDTGKAPVMRGVMDYFPNAIKEVAKVSGFGAQKYAWKNWIHVDNGFDRYSDALVRHLLDEADGINDAESGLLHAAHAAWNSLARLELLIRGLEVSDRVPHNNGEEYQGN